MEPKLTILGGGPAGLAVGYYANKHNIPFVIFEAGDEVGGNCRTFRVGEFLFDSGAHRFHDKIPFVTEELIKLMGDSLKRINVPSQIYFKGKLIDFPLSPLNLFLKLGPLDFISSGLSLLKTKKKPASNFRNFAVSKYGFKIATYFLLDYSEKLWGEKVENLSPLIAGKRLKGLNITTFLKESFLGLNAKTKHLDGAFYYPDYGFGTIVKKMTSTFPEENIEVNKTITRVFHENNTITAIEINNEKKKVSEKVISSLPINFLVKHLDPSPPKEISELASELKFRSLILVVLFIDKPQISLNASIYFPDKDVLFTRIYEPKNRSKTMAPRSKTSLVIEIPCQTEDEIYSQPKEKLINRVIADLVKFNFLTKNHILGSSLYKLNDAYPILEVGFENKVRKIEDYLSSFSNLTLAGRNGLFQYTHLHDLLFGASQIIEETRVSKLK